MPNLYLVATPIGNLEDITLRALRVLKGVGLIAAEDTRTTRQLLRHYDIHTPLTSYHEHNKRQKLPYLLKALEEKDVALVSEAGTPGLSDPGYELVAAAVERGIKVVPIPGPSALVTALTASTLPTSQFLYLGFLPRKAGERRRLLASVASQPCTLVAFEAPHRLRQSLKDILEVLGDRQTAVARELTKFHEEVFRGKVSNALEHFAEPRGEFTLVIEGKAEEKKEIPPKVVAGELRRLIKRGMLPKEARAKVASALGLPRRAVYRAWLSLKEERKEPALRSSSEPQTNSLSKGPSPGGATAGGASEAEGKGRR